MATFGDTHVGDDVNAALQIGSGEATIESQHIRAIALLTATPANSAAHAVALAKAIQLLNLNLAHLRDPRHA